MGRKMRSSWNKEGKRGWNKNRESKKLKLGSQATLYLR